MTFTLILVVYIYEKKTDLNGTDPVLAETWEGQDRKGGPAVPLAPLSQGSWQHCCLQGTVLHSGAPCFLRALADRALRAPPGALSLGLPAPLLPCSLRLSLPSLSLTSPQPPPSATLTVASVP